jgi:hypothetical protein
MDSKKLPPERIDEINNQLDNFFEALFLSPGTFEPGVIKFLANREKELTRARQIGSAIGGTVGAGLYLGRRYFTKGVYFKNVIRALFVGIMSGYVCGRLFEIQRNKEYRPELVKIAQRYNITDQEVMEMHNRANEMVLRDKQKEEHKKFSLDKVKIKF